MKHNYAFESGFYLSMLKGLTDSTPKYNGLEVADYAKLEEWLKAQLELCEKASKAGWGEDA